MEHISIHNPAKFDQKNTPFRMREPEVAFAMKELTIIEAGRLERHYWHELWPYRELFQVLTWCDLSVRYRQRAIGAI